MTEEYLGDGLYVSYDCGQFCLRAPRDWDNDDHEDVVYLDESVLALFINYVKRIQENLNECAYDRQQERLMEDGPGPSLLDQQRNALKFK